MESILDTLLSRQEELLENYSDKIALIIGLGGIGSWVALDLALVGVGTLILFDSDKIELSNLNRTLFKLSQVEQHKTKAVKDLIFERRKDTIVITHEEHFTVEHLKKYDSLDYVFDCSDTTKIKDTLKDLNISELDFQYVKLGYDGFEGTVSVNDYEAGKWGEDSSYTITPSFFGTPQILSAIGIIELLIKEETNSKTVNINVKELLNSQVVENN